MECHKLSLPIYIYIMGFMQLKVYKKAKAFSKLESQSFIPCITSKTNKRMS